MRSLATVSFFGMLVLALCESEQTNLQGAGPIPQDSSEIIPPGLDDPITESDNDDDKRSKALGLTARRQVKNIQDEQRSEVDGLDNKRSNTVNDKRSQDLELRIRGLVKNILDQQRSENDLSKREYEDEEEEEKITPEKRGNRREKQRREKQQRKKQRKQEGPAQNSLEHFSVKSLEEAKDLDIKGEENPTQVTQQQIRDTVDVHQMFRMKEEGSDIWKINWDDSLARLAQALANKCVFKHTNLYFGNGTRVGQNLAIVKGSNHSIEKVVQLFYNEKSLYDIDGHSTVDYSLVGHYLQLVYWDTVKVGCGVTFCDQLFLPDTGDTWYNTWYWACDYWPSLHANIPPYHVGNPCSECVVPSGKGIGWMCVDNTCEECNIGDPGCNEPEPCTKFDPDVQSKAMCDKVKKHKFCEKGSRGYRFAKLYCRTTCQFCRGIPESMGGGN
ncbi:cysteine-rich venom protein natrin-1-like [Ylistrum balloti]|uniref:cysteine-rich venom protein natrin-1-like n=1 Tax=Ylistrum balloti TaxID=509963 RepID=UPI002905DE11|nr:cysteine-rich venom protein natrin-1-like [Ylistrum balloti]